MFRFGAEDFRLRAWRLGFGVYAFWIRVVVFVALVAGSGFGVLGLI